MGISYFCPVINKLSELTSLAKKSDAPKTASGRSFTLDVSIVESNPLAMYIFCGADSTNPLEIIISATPIFIPDIHGIFKDMEELVTVHELSFFISIPFIFIISIYFAELV